MSDGPTPPGWSANPSSWCERLPIVGLALAGFAVAGYLALYQRGLLADVREPFFGDGSRIILDSRISHLLPVPAAALGALGYLLDAVTGLTGGRDRWRAIPWVVVLFGLAVGPLGAVSIVLVIFQPVLFDGWCTLCLASAVVSLAMIGPAMDEVLASLQHLRRAHAEGRSHTPQPAAPRPPQARARGGAPGVADVLGTRRRRCGRSSLARSSASG